MGSTRRQDSAGDIQTAKQHLDEARMLDPTATITRLETRIRLIEHGPEDALKALPDRDDLESLCARGSILITLGESDEAIRVLRTAREHDSKDADALRLLALAHLLGGDLESAQGTLAALISVAPDWEIVRHTKAVIDYISTLAFPSLQSPASAMADPVEWSLVRRDDQSLKRLTESEAIFGDLLADVDRTREDRQMLETWRGFLRRSVSARRISIIPLAIPYIGTSRYRSLRFYPQVAPASCDFTASTKRPHRFPAGQQRTEWRPLFSIVWTGRRFWPVLAGYQLPSLPRLKMLTS
jgi:thioredoxin-like negative regulator of GroEL